MGSTGARSSRTGIESKDATKEYSIKGTTSFRGKLPKESGMVEQTDKNITVSTVSKGTQNIIFQFTLTDDNQYVSVTAYNPRTKQRASISVPAARPSITQLQKNGNSSQKVKAERMLAMMSESGAVSDTALPGIVTRLRSRRR